MAHRRGTSCALCGLRSDDLTDEDVFPTWVRTFLVSGVANIPTDNQWPRKVLLPACRDCNESLGAEFEDPAAPILKPLLRGECRSLNHDQAKVAAAWAALKDIEHILADPFSVTGQGERVALAATDVASWRHQLMKLRGSLQPPPGFLLRLARYGPADAAAFYRPFLPVEWRREFALVASVATVGHLIIESLWSTPEIVSSLVRYMDADPRATLVWPPQSEPGTVGQVAVPLNHLDRWRSEHAFHPASAAGGGWHIPPIRHTRRTRP